MAIAVRPRRCPLAARAFAKVMKPARPLLARLAALAAAGGALLATGPALGWSQATHSTTGAIAWADLAAHDGDALAELVQIARHHPDYPLFERRAAGLAPAVKQRALFEWLARWSDDIRGGPEDRPKWHYSLHVVSGRTWLWKIRNGAALDGFAYNYAKLSDPCARPADRAKAIGWLIHIIGDVQQPLHGGHQMTATFPGTDRAGELAFVRRFADSEPVDLHHYWDEIFQQARVSPRGGDWAEAIARAWPRSRIPELARQGTPQALFGSYLTESETLARLVAYQGTFLRSVPKGHQAPVVTELENRTALILSERRVATGGYRIADMLARAVHQARADRTVCPV